MQEMRVRALSQEDPLEEEMATHSSNLARKNPTDRGAWWATVHGVAKEPETTEQLPSGSAVKNPPAMQEMRVLAREDPLEKEMATRSSILVWEIPWTEKPGGQLSMESQESWTRVSD